MIKIHWWVNGLILLDYNEYINDTQVVANGHNFKYLIHSDSIGFQYAGKYLTLCLESSSQISG